MKIKEGDMVTIVKTIPEWNWLPFKEGDIGMVLGSDYNPNFTMLTVFIFRTKQRESIPEYFVEKMEKQ